MVSAFLEVVEDLFWFVFGRTSVVTTPSLAEPKHLAAPAVPINLPTVPVVPALSSRVAEPKEETVPPVLSLHEPVVMYVKNLAGAQSLVSPVFSFDGVQTVFPYGTAVTVSSYSGNYARTLRGSITGWVMKDDLTPHKNDVWPTFMPWVIYGATAAETTKVRALIADSFAAGRLDLPLQAGEYIVVRLLSDNRLIVWPDNRPRVPGVWQNLLKGVQGIHNSIMPKTDSIMEWQSESDGGRLAYVESVGPDNTITTTCVGLIVAGQYTKQTWTQEEWRELRPVFIEVD